ncbi:MAG: DMT family transporter [Candidatus Bathyarchaeia archaeon]
MKSSETLTYVIPYILIATFQYQVAKDGLNYSSPFILMALRYLIASFIIFGISRRFRPILNKDMIILSVCTWASSGLWAIGLQFVSPAESAVLSYTMPLFAIPLAIVIVGEKTSRSGWAGAIVGFAGVMIYAIPLSRNRLTIFGGVLTLVDAMFWAAYTVYYRKVRRQDPMRTIATQLLLAGSLFLLGAPLGFRLVYSSNLVFDVAYLALLNGAVLIYLWNALARLQKISRMSTLVYMIPATATLFEFAQTRIIPNILSILGVGLMLFGIYLSRLEGQ